MANFLKQRVASLFSPRGKLRYALSLIEAGEVGRAFAPLSAAATAGIPEAQFRVGRAYLDGAGVPVSREEGARWIERAAEAGWVEAQVVLATLHLFGLVVSGGSGSAVFSIGPSQQDAKPDYERAAQWASRAAEAGSPDGQALLGYILTSGPAEMRDLDVADGWYARSAEAGCPQGHLGVALAQLRNALDAEGQQKAATSLAKAAEGGLGTALYLLGVMTERGAGVKQDVSAATELYRQAAERRVRSGEARYGLALMEGRGVERNTARGESWLRRAALGGDAEAAALVGDLYSRGGDLPPNYAEAASWYGRAAAAGHAASARARGLRYRTGARVQRAPAAAAPRRTTRCRSSFRVGFCRTSRRFSPSSWPRTGC